MTPASETTLTELLESASGGDERALERAFTRVYDELRALAHQVRGSRDETLNTTALVHEAYLKLIPSAEIAWQNRAHFFAVAARAMRQVLIDAARRRLAARRGAGAVCAVTYDDDAHATPLRPARLIALDDALARLSAIEPRRARVVEFRFWCGLTTQEIAALLAVSTGTVERDWRAARAWLAVELGEDDGDAA